MTLCLTPRPAPLECHILFEWLLSEIIFFKLFFYPREDGKECKEDRSDDVGGCEAEHVVALAPGVAHVAEDDEEHEAPEPGEGHVENNKVLSSLNRRHLLKKPEKSF